MEIEKNKKTTIRPIEIFDCEFLYKLMNSEKWIKHIGDRNIQSIEDAKNYILNIISSPLYEAGITTYIILDKKNLTKIGVCGLYTRDNIKGVDLGFAILPEYEGNSYTLEASMTLINLAHQKFKIMDLFAYTSEENIASQKLLLKLQFVPNGNQYFSSTNETLLSFHKKLT